MAILDLDGPTRRPRRGRVFEALLASAATLLVAGFFLSVPHWPREWTQRTDLPPVVIPNAFSVLAHAQPAPSRTLELPDDLGTVIQQRGPNGETGLIARDTAITLVRLRTGDVVAFGAVPATPSVGAGLDVRGSAGFTFVENGLTVVRWMENATMYEMSSRTLDAARLVEIAGSLR